MTLQLVNCYLEPSTLSNIAASCPYLQRLCLTDFKAYDTSAPRKRWEIVFEAQPQQASSLTSSTAGNSNSSSQNTSTGAAGRGTGLASSSGGGGGGGRGSGMRRVLRDVDEPAGVEVDWSALAKMRCLNALSLKSSRSQVLAAARNLARLQHSVKNLKLEAQGLKLADLEAIGNQLPLLPHLTWLTLVLQYKPERRRQLDSDAAEEQPTCAGGRAAAVAGAGDAPGAAAGDVAAQAAAIAQGFPLQIPPVPWAQLLQQHHAHHQQQQQQLPGEQGNAGPGAWPVLWPGAALQGAWQWEAADRLSKVLMKELPGTALELKVRPQSTMFFG
jgi:hypothetical protein